MKRIALIASLLIVVSGCYYLLTKQQSAEAIIEFNSFGKADSPKKSGSTKFTRSSFYTQFSIVRNQEVVSRAIDDYNLDTLFETNKEILLKEIKENINTNKKKDQTKFSSKPSPTLKKKLNKSATPSSIPMIKSAEKTSRTREIKLSPNISRR